MVQKVRKAVFPVAGLGTRFLPATKSIPKEMLPILDKPLIQYALDEAQAAGIEEFIFVSAEGKSAIEDYFSPSPALEEILEGQGKKKILADLKSSLPPQGSVTFVCQNEPLGLGHAVWCARDQVGDEPFAVILVDDYITGETPCLKQMSDAFNDVGGNILAVRNVPLDQVHRYGVLDPGVQENNLIVVKGLVEKPSPEEAPSTLSVVGRYILMPEVFSHLARHDKGAGGEIQLTDALAKMIGHGPFHGLLFEGERIDCGNRQGFLEANFKTALRDPELRDFALGLGKKD